MSGLLPGTRPVSDNYGPNVIDDRPVEDPDRETSGETWNKLKADVAYAARMVPLLRIRVANTGPYAGSPAVIHVRGPEGIEASSVTVSWQNDGRVRVDISGTGITLEDVVAQALKVTGKLMTAAVEILSATTFEVQTWDQTSGEWDGDFTALVF